MGVFIEGYLPMYISKTETPVLVRCICHRNVGSNHVKCVGKDIIFWQMDIHLQSSADDHIHNPSDHQFNYSTGDYVLTNFDAKKKKIKAFICQILHADCDDYQSLSWEAITGKLSSLSEY